MWWTRVTLALWAALLIGSGVYMGALDRSAREGWGQRWRALGFISLVYGVMLLIGAASGAQDPLKPLARVAGGSGSGVGAEVAAAEAWRPIDDLASLEVALQQTGGRPAILDLYADWCISCKIMERDVFPLPQIATRFEKFNLLRADITENNAAHKALLDHYGLFGPPSILFFSADGRELREFRVQGELDAVAMEAQLEQVLASL